MEKKRLGTERYAHAAKATSPNKKRNKQQIGVNDNQLSRFTVKSANNSIGERTTPTSTETTSKKAAKKKSKLILNGEKRLFDEKPELFEKRMVIIDGSNVAYS